MALTPTPRGYLFRKYALYFVTLVSVALLASGALGLYFSYQENRAALVALQREKALAAAGKIEQYIGDIEHQIGWTALPQAGAGAQQRRFDYLKLLRQVPAITEIGYIDDKGREQLRVSRLGLDAAGSNADYTRDPRYVEVAARGIYYGPVYFRKETEPYMTIAVRASQSGASVTAVEVNLKFVWDVVSRIKAGAAGYAYVVDARGQLISHPDISLVLQKTDLSALPQVRDALARDAAAIVGAEAIGEDLRGRPVLAASATIPTLGWTVFVEQPQAEALAPLYASVARTGVLLLFGLLLSVAAGVLLARRMVTPIRALQAGAERIGAGALDQRIDVHTGDELESLADQFNRMGEQLRESYANLEKKVEDRTRELALANQAKSRFLAAASHDLRQPMHALGLFVAQLRDLVHAPEAREIVGHIDTSVAAVEGLLDALLDISRLDAGVLTPHVEDFPVSALLARMQNAFAPAAEAKGLRLRVVPSGLIVRSDPVLLERVIMNLVSNAIRYTARGGVLFGCRRQGNAVRIEVWDSGVGIPPDKQQEIFQEFYQLGNPERDRSKGLGLGLAIVERMARLLEHPIGLRSAPGKGSVFAITLPRGVAAHASTGVERPAVDEWHGAFVLVVDDEPLVRESMRGVLQRWGCHVLCAANGETAITALGEHDRIPDLIISDYRLQGEENGIQVIARVRENLGYAVPAVLISGDTAPERLREARASGYQLLHKPVQPAKLRAALTRLLSEEQRRRAAI